MCMSASACRVVGACGSVTAASCRAVPSTTHPARIAAAQLSARSESAMTADRLTPTDEPTRPTCSVDGCEKKVDARGWCSQHYQRWYFYRDVNRKPWPSRPLLDRIADKFLVGDGCWEWIGAKVYGYGRLSRGRTPDGSQLAHRVVYELMTGPIPEGLTLDHLCRNRGCVRPDHLEPVSLAENTRRGAAARTHCPQGHEFTPENTYCRPSKVERQCRICLKERSRARCAALRSHS